jgi:hypothetical protein
MSNDGDGVKAVTYHSSYVELRLLPCRELKRMNSYRMKLITIMLMLFVIIEYRLFEVAEVTDNWRGLAITTTHLAVVAAGAYWGLVRAQSH